jgi:opacity protein-like surface antigen
MRLLLTSLIAVAIAAGVTQSRADDAETVKPLEAGSYFTMLGGLNLVTGGNAVDADRVPPNLKFKFNDGAAVSASGGYKWSIGLRTEVELSYRTNGVKDFDSNAFPLSGSQRDLSVMANALYDIKTGTKFMPYFGAGVGITWLHWDNFANAASSQIVYSDGGTKLAFQAILGIAYAFAPQWEAILDARYKGSSGHSFLGVQSTDSISGYKLRDSTLMAGIRYAF